MKIINTPIRYKEIYPELDRPVRVLQEINNEIY